MYTELYLEMQQIFGRSRNCSLFSKLILDELSGIVHDS